MGYDNISFTYDPTNDFLVKLVKNDVIENQTVVFKLKKWMMKHYPFYFINRFQSRKKPTESIGKTR